MTPSPRGRRYLHRQQQIIEHARQIAEREGWASVTTRRLAQEINHSQPVIYQHFRSRDHVLAAVVTQGFLELTSLIREAASGPGCALERLCWSYLDFGRQNPALYEAMFTNPTLSGSRRRILPQSCGNPSMHLPGSSSRRPGR